VHGFTPQLTGILILLAISSSNLKDQIQVGPATKTYHLMGAYQQAQNRIIQVRILLVRFEVLTRMFMTISKPPREVCHVN
jgi:hypothetical protein